jgi:outer membrane protein W
MRFHFCLALLFTALATVASAQTTDWFVRGMRSYPEGSTEVRNGTAKLELESGMGGEVGVNRFCGRHVSTEFSVGSVRHDLDATAFGQHVDLGATRFTPISLLFQLHSNPDGAFDFHVGAGPAFVILGNISNTSELQLLGVREIRFHDRFAPVVDAGFDFHFSERWALSVDAKYFDIHSKTTATYSDGTRETAGLDLKQLSVGAGVGLRF